MISSTEAFKSNSLAISSASLSYLLSIAWNSLKSTLPSLFVSVRDMNLLKSALLTFISRAVKAHSNSRGEKMPSPFLSNIWKASAMSMPLSPIFPISSLLSLLTSSFYCTLTASLSLFASIFLSTTVDVCSLFSNPSIVALKASSFTAAASCTGVFPCLFSIVMSASYSKTKHLITSSC